MVKRVLRSVQRFKEEEEERLHTKAFGSCLKDTIG